MEEKLRTNSNKYFAEDNMPSLNANDKMPSLAHLDINDYKEQNGGHSSSSQDQEENMFRVVVSNIPIGASEFEVMKIFNNYYPRHCLVILDKPERRYKEGTLALVYFGDEMQAALAERYLDRSEYQGKTIRVWNLC